MDYAIDALLVLFVLALARIAAHAAPERTPAAYARERLATDTPPDR